MSRSTAMQMAKTCPEIALNLLANLEAVKVVIPGQ